MNRDIEEYTKRLIRERTYTMRGSLQTQVGQVIDYQASIINKLREYGFAHKALTPYTGLPAGEVRKILTDPPEQNLEQLKLCLQVLLDIEAKLLPSYDNIKSYDRTRQYDRKCERYVNNLRPPFGIWTDLVRVHVDEKMKTIPTQTACEVHLTSPKNRLPMAYCRAIRKAAKITQREMARWLGLKPSDVSQLEMRDPYMYYGKPTLETQNRMTAYQEIIDVLVVKMSRTTVGEAAFKEHQQVPLEEPNYKATDAPPPPDKQEPASLLGNFSAVHLRTQPMLHEAFRSARKKVRDLGLMEEPTEDIPDHVIIQRVVDNPMLMIKIVKRLGAEDLFNPALMPHSSKEINEKRANVMNRLSIMAEGLDSIMESITNRLRALATVSAEISDIFDELLGSAPRSTELEHANPEDRENKYLQELAASQKTRSHHQH